MGVNKIHGMIPMKEHVRAEDLSQYKIVPPNAFAYNPMRLNIGSLAINMHGREVTRTSVPSKLNSLGRHTAWLRHRN